VDTGDERRARVYNGSTGGSPAGSRAEPLISESWIERATWSWKPYSLLMPNRSSKSRRSPCFANWPVKLQT